MGYGFVDIFAIMTEAKRERCSGVEAIAMRVVNFNPDFVRQWFRRQRAVDPGSCIY